MSGFERPDPIAVANVLQERRSVVCAMYGHRPRKTLPFGKMPGTPEEHATLLGAAFAACLRCGRPL